MKANYLSDGHLVSLYINGSEKAFEQLLNRHKSKIYTTIYLIVRDQYIAEDLLQETFIKAIKKLRSGSYNEEGKFAPWIVRIAHNLAIDYFRREKRYPTIVMEDGSNIFNSIEFSENSMESVRIKDETHETLKKMIEALPDAQKEVLIMRHYSDMSFQEIAESTGVSINTALGRMRYALINLRKKLEKSNIAYDQNLYPE
jgi:RNA polymerase sigma factor (sigma-70 family)